MTRTKSASNNLYRAFLADIARGDIRPGERLGEESLAARWKVGRVPVRETLMRLEQDGLVIRKNKSGTYVREITDAEVLEIYDIRIGIEPLIASSATERATPAEIRTLQSLAEEADRRGDPGFEMEARDRAFHSKLGQISGLRHAPRIISVSRLHMRCATISRFMALLGGYTVSHPDHLPIVQAMAEGNAKSAARTMLLHLRHAKQAVMNDMKRVEKLVGRIGHASEQPRSKRRNV